MNPVMIEMLARMKQDENRRDIEKSSRFSPGDDTINPRDFLLTLLAVAGTIVFLIVLAYGSSSYFMG